MEGWYKLNTDGASFGNPGKARERGIIRDKEGHWLKGFSRSIGFTSSIMVELWALRVAHVFKEANKCADALAKRKYSLQEDFVVFDTLRPLLKFLIYLALMLMDCIIIDFQSQLWS